mmetsp:Transcript_54359/g.116074  ORF Transcript_54359/g.116074 Transcript_54359/m.116074 type:complete len:205 (+) Transcript_54359:517-1131(+)
MDGHDVRTLEDRFEVHLSADEVWFRAARPTQYLLRAEGREELCCAIADSSDANDPNSLVADLEPTLRDHPLAFPNGTVANHHLSEARDSEAHRQLGHRISGVCRDIHHRNPSLSACFHVHMVEPSERNCYHLAVGVLVQNLLCDWRCDSDKAPCIGRSIQTPLAAETLSTQCCFGIRSRNLLVLDECNLLEGSSCESSSTLEKS